MSKSLKPVQQTKNSLTKRSELPALEKKLEPSHTANEYEQARKEFMAVLDKGFDLGTCGEITWTRDELHER